MEKHGLEFQHNAFLTGWDGWLILCTNDFTEVGVFAGPDDFHYKILAWVVDVLDVVDELPLFAGFWFESTHRLSIPVTGLTRCPGENRVPLFTIGGTHLILRGQR